MKNKLLLIILLFPFSLFCQWNKIVSNTSKNLNAIAFSSSALGLAVGDSGILLKVTSTGSSYTASNSGTTKNLKDVCFLEGSASAVAVGNKGSILLSTDNGNKWDSIYSTTTNDLNAVTFFNSTNGIIVGNNGCVLKTINGGVSWTSISPVTVYLLNKVLYLSSSEIIACGANGLVIRSTNGGDNWSIVNAGTNRYLTDLISYSDSLIFVGDKGIALMANSTMSVFQKDSLCAEQLRGIYCGTNSCIAVGKNAKIMAKLHGDIWQSISNSYHQNFNDIQFINDTTAIIVGDSSLVLKTVTGGISNSTIELENLPPVIYPNPSQGEFSILLSDIPSGKLTLQIINSLGIIVWDKSIQSNEKIIHISENFSSGVYIVRLYGDGNTWTETMVLY